MIFSSVIFLFFFLPFACSIYYLSWKKGRNVVLLISSLIFYIWGGREQVLVLLLSILLNTLLGLSFIIVDSTTAAGKPAGGSPRSTASTTDRDAIRKLLLSLGIAVNLMILLFYKYINFLVSNLNLPLSLLDLPVIAMDTVVAPPGISFITFHALSYLIDTYRRDTAPQRNPLRLALYLALFPKILAGPILKYRDAEDQLGDRHPNLRSLISAIRLFIIGLGKKVLIANPLAAVADKIFAVPAGELGFEVAWIGIVCFTLQIYFDFSGYTDMAIGLGRVFGFELPENFRYPYVSQSIQEFWRRWHITLSSWFRDYLYIPLGGNRCSPARQYRNLLIVFVLCGFWHGASWNFILWGLWYGLFLILERTGVGRVLKTAWRPLRHLYALAVIVIGWVFFRADTLSHTLNYLQALLGFNGAGSGQYYPEQYVDNEVVLIVIVGIIAAMPIKTLMGKLGESLAGESREQPRSLALGISLLHLAALGFLFILSCSAVAVGTYSPFIYFKF